MIAPAVLCDREDRLTPAKKIPEPLTPEPLTRSGPGLRPVLWHYGTDEGIFFNLNLNFAHTGSRTQDLRSAAGFL